MDEEEENQRSWSPEQRLRSQWYLMSASGRGAMHFMLSNDDKLALLPARFDAGRFRVRTLISSSLSDSSESSSVQAGASSSWPSGARMMACCTVSLKWMCFLGGAFGDSVSDFGIDASGASLIGTSIATGRLWLWPESEFALDIPGLPPDSLLRRYGRENCRSASLMARPCWLCTSDADEYDFCNMACSTVFFFKIGFFSNEKGSIRLRGASRSLCGARSCRGPYNQVVSQSFILSRVSVIRTTS